LDKTSAKGPAFDQPSRRGQENGEKLPEFSSTKCGWDTVWDVEPTKMLIFHGILLIQLKILMIFTGSRWVYLSWLSVEDETNHTRDIMCIFVGIYIL
jgi:hypothetical protein